MRCENCPANKFYYDKFFEEYKIKCLITDKFQSKRCCSRHYEMVLAQLRKITGGQNE